MDAKWRPETIDPLGQAMGVPEARERSYAIWLDLRESEITFAQMVVVKLFYAVRRIVDEAGRALPKGAKVEGLLFDEERFDFADTIGVEMPAYVVRAPGDKVFNATVNGQMDEVPTRLRSAADLDALISAQEELQSTGPSAIALPADPMLWAVSLTGLQPADLEMKAANEGA